MTEQTPTPMTGTAVTPITLRAFTAEAAKLQSALLRVTDPLALTANDVQLFAGIEAPRAENAAAPWLSLHLNGQPLAAQLSWNNARRLIGDSLEQASPDDAALLIEESIAALLDEAERALDISLRFDRLELSPPDLPVCATLNVQGQGTDRAFVQARLPLRMSPDAARALTAALAPKRAKRTKTPGLMFTLPHEVDTVMLSVATLGDLAVGDAVELSPDATPRLVLNETLFAPLSNTDGILRLLAPFRPLPLTLTPEEQIMPSDDATPTDAAATATEGLSEATLDEIEVRLSFRAGSTSMDLAGLRGLAPGAIIETTDDATALVDIVVNGRSIGTGELIDVAGRRAVQIRTLFARD